LCLHCSAEPPVRELVQAAARAEQQGPVRELAQGLVV